MFFLSVMPIVFGFGVSFFESSFFAVDMTVFFVTGDSTHVGLVVGLDCFVFV